MIPNYTPISHRAFLSTLGRFIVKLCKRCPIKQTRGIAGDSRKVNKKLRNRGRFISRIITSYLPRPGQIKLRAKINGFESKRKESGLSEIQLPEGILCLDLVA
ncbi:hypothetical protein CDAR_217671 [Caerostris darwini]|uniref:Uncharacterized protein n=1 Tax=Caerostris darwini TaxID=1538125 RepID=A0AAV4U9C8_9ARAC|nr:hypothetical protein CDAR_217671 [Caerostris darwini]